MATVTSQILHAIDNLERFGRHRFPSGHIEIERVSIAYAIDAYKRTLTSVPLRIELEPLSSVMVSEATIEWEAQEQEVGVRVRQTHRGKVRPELYPLLKTWAAAGYPYPSGGGVYGTVPNKSFQRIQDLTRYPDLRDSVRHFQDMDSWLLFWEKFINLRDEASATLLDALNTTDPEALSRGNEEAGMGIQLRGQRLKRADAWAFRSDLRFLLDYQWDSAVAFAATQMAALPADQVFMTKVQDPRIKGSIASRSDVDIKDVNWDGDYLTIQAEAGTRQVGGDGTGALSNSKSERKLKGASVTEEVIRQIRPANVFYPNLDKKKLLEFWATGVNPKEPPYIIGEDFGLTEPIKAGADNLFSRNFISIGKKVMPDLFSGRSWTQAVYVYFHIQFSKRAPGSEFLCLGDDLNMRTATETDAVFAPYIKVKSTKPETNDKKMLGLWVRTDVKNDKAVFAIVPRVCKTLSSASKRGSAWKEILSAAQGRTGKILLKVPEAAEHEIATTLAATKKYMFWEGRMRDLKPTLDGLWGNIPMADYQKLKLIKDDLEYRLQPADDEAAEAQQEDD